MDDNNIQSNPKTLRTYSSDMADAIRENEASVIKIALAEQKKHEREDIYRQAEGTPAKKIIFILGGIVLISIALGSWYFISQKKAAQNAPVQATPQIETFVSYESNVFIDATKAKEKIDMENLITGAVAPGKPLSIKALFLTTTKTGTPEILPVNSLLSSLQITAPGTLVRSLDNNYLLGTYTAQDSKVYMFLILQTNDYNQAYAGMLEWEKTMLSDLYHIFNTDVSGTRQVLLEKEFKDIIINNKDARILYDDGGKDVLYYIFLDKGTIVITDSSEAIKEINSRMIIKKIKPL